jgi:hypothetical protein
LKRAGFEVKEFVASEVYGDALVERYRLSKDEVLYIASKRN